MKKRICPICDQVMGSKHYCKNCKRIVKNPWVREVGYYLNERHPADEHGCSYHDDPFEVERLREKRRWASADERYDGKRGAAGQQRNHAAGRWQQDMKHGRSRSAKAEKKSGAGKVLLIILLIYMVVQVVLPILVILMGELMGTFWYLF